MTSLGAFELEEVLGEGGMGQVWSAWHRGSGLPVAIKVVPVIDAELQDRLELEVRAQARLDHPNIAAVLDYGRVPPHVTQEIPGMHRGAPWFAMEYCGVEVADVVASFGWPEIRRVLRRLLAALAHAHARGVLHLDLKLNNLLIAGPDEARPGLKVVDFGVAHLLSESPSAYQVAGTPRYMAPEQLMGDGWSLGPWTDLYAVGVIAWRMLTGRVPWRGLSLPQLVAARRIHGLPMGDWRVPVPDDIASWLHRLLAPRPEDRFQLAADAAAELEHLEGTSEPIDTQLTVRFESTPSEDDPTTYSEDPALNDSVIATAEPGGMRTPVSHTLLRDPPELTKGAVALAGAGVSLLDWRVPPMHGRHEQRDSLWTLFRQVKAQGRGAAARIDGLPGSGRSRLMQWMAEAVRTTGQGHAIWVEGSPRQTCVESLLFALRRWLRIDADDPDPLGRVHTWVGKDALAEVLLRMMRAPQRASDGLPPLVQALARIATGRGLVLVVDDAEPSTADVVNAIIRFHAPILVLVASDTAVEIEDTTRVELAPLPSSVLERIVTATAPLSPEATAGLVSRAGGNAGFAVSVVRHWAERGLLHNTADGMEPRGDMSLPPRLAILGATQREALLSGLSEAEVAAVEVAGVMGPDLDEDEWRRAHAQLHPDARAGFWRVLMRMLRHRILSESGMGWRFRSLAVMEAIRDGVEDPSRTHLAAATVLAETSFDPLEQARHLAGAGRVLQALPLMLKGADDARMRFGRHAVQSVVGPFRELAGTTGDPKWALHARILDIVSEPDRPGALDRGREIQERAWTIEDDELKARAAMAVALVLHVTGELAKASPTLRRALALEDVEPATRAWLLHRNAHVAYAQRDLARMRAAVAAASPALRAVKRGHLADQLEILLATVEGDPEITLARCDDAIASAREHNLVYDIAHGHYQRAMARGALYQLEGAAEDLQEAVTYSELAGMPDAAALSASTQLLMYQDLEDWSEAEGAWERNQRLLPVRSGSTRRWADTVLRLHALPILVRAEDWDAVHHHLDRMEVQPLHTSVGKEWTAWSLHVAEEGCRESGQVELADAIREFREALVPGVSPTPKRRKR